MEYKETVQMVLKEEKAALLAVDPEAADRFIEMVLSARKVFVVGVGRVELSLLAMVKRFNHLGIDANYVGAVNEPAITEDDILIVGSGSGETAIPVAIARIAKKFHAKVIHIGSNTQSTVASLSDLVVRIPCRTKLRLEGEIDSTQPMSSLFEQSLLLFGDIVACLIIERKQLDLQELWHTHANLE